MSMSLIKTKPEEWDEFVNSHPNGHPFQLSGWAELKRHVGWEYAHYALKSKDGRLSAGAQVLFLKIPAIGAKIAYIPKGPIAAEDTDRSSLLLRLANEAKDRGAIVLKVEPEWENDRELQSWRKTKRTILHPETLIKDLDASGEKELFDNLDSEVRYSVRKAGRNGVTAELVEDEVLPGYIWNLYEETGRRAGFNLHTEGYYRQAYGLMKDHGNIWLARHKGKPIAFVWTIHASKTAVFLYGGSDDTARKTLANYLLQWEVIRHYWQKGFAVYDLNGDVTENVGSYKRKFATREVSWVGTYDLPLNKPLYWLWESSLPIIKPLARSLKQARERVGSSDS